MLAPSSGVSSDGGFVRPIWRRCRPAIPSRTRPSTILTTKMPVAGDVPLAGGEFPVAEMVTAATAASAASQPKMNPAPFRGPFFDATIKMKIVSATGYSAIARPMRTRSTTTGRTRS